MFGPEEEKASNEPVMTEAWVYVNNSHLQRLHIHYAVIRGTFSRTDANILNNAN